MAHGERVMSAAEFERVWAAEWSSLVNFVAFLGADAQEAEDAAQSAFMDLWSQTEPVNHFRAWLRIAAERAFWKSNAKVARQRVAHERLVWPFAPDPATKIIFRQEVAAIMALVHTLPAEQRRVFAWRMDDFEFSEIAEHLKKPEATVRSNFRHAKAQLKKLSTVKEMHQRHRPDPTSITPEGGMDDERSRVE